MAYPLGECETVAYADGLAVGLAAALIGVDATAPPGRVAAVPSDMVPPGTAAIAHRLAALERISLMRCSNLTQGQDLTGFAARLGAVRLGITRRLIEHVIEHLSSRSAGGEPIIRKQLVSGELADVLTDIEAIRHCLSVAGQVPVAVVDVHDQLTVLDWKAAKLLGASGYLAGSPTRSAYVARLTANCWIARAAN